MNLPDARAKPLDQDAKPVAISLDADGRIFVGEAEIQTADLPNMLTRLAERAGDKPPQIFLRADKALDYGRVMAVMGELNRAGLNRVALVAVGQDGP